MDSCKEANYVYPIYFGEHCNIGDLVLLDQYRSDQVRKLNPYDSQCTDPVAFGESSKINSSTVRQNTATTPTTTEHLESSARELPMDSNIGDGCPAPTATPDDDNGDDGEDDDGGAGPVIGPLNIMAAVIPMDWSPCPIACAVCNPNRGRPDGGDRGDCDCGYCDCGDDGGDSDGGSSRYVLPDDECVCSSSLDIVLGSSRESFGSSRDSFGSSDDGGSSRSSSLPQLRFKRKRTEPGPRADASRRKRPRK